MGQIYDNRLSDLAPVKGEVVCTLNRDDGISGEHYCNCVSDCELHPDWCGCAEAGLCCEKGINNHKECLVCNEGLKNPEFNVDSMGSSCLEASEELRTSIDGQSAQCNQTKGLLLTLGCL